MKPDFITKKNARPVATFTPPHSNGFKTFNPTIRASAIATNGDLWTWNCGWVRNKGGSTPLGHSTFRSAVKLFNKTQPDAGSVLMGVDRPQRQWRRIVEMDRMEHSIYGIVELLATDGCHAMVRSHNFEGSRRVSYDNLSEIEVPKEPKERVKTDNIQLVLGKVKKVDRALEMVLDKRITDIGARLQFIRDVEVYNLWEALQLYADATLEEELKKKYSKKKKTTKKPKVDMSAKYLNMLLGD